MGVLVTGGAGYIGSHTCVELLQAGYDVVVVDKLSNSKSESLKRVRKITKRDFKFYNMDLLEKDKLESVFCDNDIEAVIHFAGFKSVMESVQFPLRYYHNNITSTLVLCETMQKMGIKKLVFSSSATVYGTPESLPISEGHCLRSTNPYGRTKLMIEQILNDLYLSDNNWNIAILRYFNPIGAHPSGLLGEDPNGVPNNLLPYISQVAVGRLQFLKIYGSDYATPDGTGIRDYIHVVDLSKGHLRALEKVMATTGLDTYNLGTGRGTSVLEMVRAFEKVSGVKILYTLEERRLGDVAICYADPSKAEMSLGWIAEKGIEDMCEDAWRWQLHNPNGYCE